MTVFDTTPIQGLSQAESCLIVPYGTRELNKFFMKILCCGSSLDFTGRADRSLCKSLYQRLPQSLFLCSMSCYKHWYACPETIALQLTTEC